MNKEFCKQYYLPPTDWLLNLDLPVSECGNYSNFDTRLIQVVGDYIRVSTPLGDFDRWANSVDYVFNLTKENDRELLVDFIVNNKDPEDEDLYGMTRYNECREESLK